MTAVELSATLDPTGELEIEESKALHPAQGFTPASPAGAESGGTACGIDSPPANHRTPDLRLIKGAKP